MRSKYLSISPEAAEVINLYKLLKIGLTYTDLHILPCDMADKLLLLDNEIGKYEEEQMKKAERGKK